jgi:Fe-S cluster biogenesis protein NfuA
MPEYSVFYEATPNPQSMKFIVTAMISPESANFANLAEAQRSPLAQKLLGFPWAAGVFIGPTFVTVTKQEWVDWDVIAEPLSELIKEHLERGEPVIHPAQSAEGRQYISSGDDSTEDSEGDSPTVLQIKKILREEIRPAVAMDGGDITFSKYEDGRVYLHMQGACSGCPSSAITLKEGIETRLRDAIPEIQEVIAI